ncbi:helix-turn-helix transcriptional regulator [Leuconostoc mesenteroides]|uniref:helix-turn-helix transcriptional regulator n=1 Tax=Leuconostoc mesenteroides TaxID=1245 RepID=UPI0009B8EF8B|nr:helix-turn-helix transcriptional regulator [Leuconostoc mesenteroides]
MNNKKRSIIKETRQKRGISQQQLGVLIGSQSMVSRIENNKTEPTDYTVLLLCNALNISFEEYFSTVFREKKIT